MPKYATSQIVKDTLQPFKETQLFDPRTTTNGMITINNVDYYDLLDCTIQYTQDGRAGYFSVKMSNEDEIADRLNSQINPPTATTPVGQMFTTKYSGIPTFNYYTQYQIQLYPKRDIYTGFLYYMRKPIKPVYAYTIVGGRNIVYDPATSVQLEWRDNDITTILLKALASIGINMSDQEVSQFAELKNQQNYQGVNHL